MPETNKIGEAAALLNLKTYVLRFWETEFPQIAPLRTETGRRVYTADHLALLERIRFLLHERGLTIDGARRILNEEAAKGVHYALPAVPGQAPGMAEGVGASAGVDPALFDAPTLDPASLDTPTLPLTEDERHFLEKDSAKLFSQAAEPIPGDVARLDLNFLREIRTELEHVVALLAAGPSRGDNPE